MGRLFALTALLLALPAHGVVMEWVTVGDPGNAPDDTQFGSVGYVYRIGKYAVTNAQYTEFLNAVAADDPNNLYDVEMAGVMVPTATWLITRESRVEIADNRSRADPEG